MAHLEVYLPDGQVEHFELSKPTMTIGRSAEADIEIHEPVISRVHVRLQRTVSNRWIVADLDSRNHTFFQGRPIKSHVLASGDAVFLGSIKTVFRDPSGASDKPGDQTTFLPHGKGHSAAPSDVQAQRKHCSNCRAVLPAEAELCVNCGYNFATGEQMASAEDASSGTKTLLEFLDEEEAEAAPAPPPRSQRAAKLRPARRSGNAVALVIDWIVPLGLIGVFVLALLIRLELSSLVAAMGLVFNTVIILVAMALTTKIGSFQFGDFGPAIVKVLGIAAGIGLASFLAWPGDLIFIVILIFGLFKLLFEPDWIEWAVMSAVTTVLHLALVWGYLLEEFERTFRQMMGS